MFAWFNALEHNVKYVFLFTIPYWSANSIISQQVLSGYIFVLTGSNEPVGIVKGIQGVSQLLFAFPAGFAADYLRRDKILSVAGVLGFFTSILSALAFQIGHLKLICVAFSLWGIFSALQNPTMEALFADSIPSGQRSLPFTMKHIVLNTALVIGPLSAIMLFLHYGDVWEVEVLRPVVLFGTFLAAISMGVLFMFNDDKAYENKQRKLEVDRQLRSIERNFDAELSCFVDERSHVSLKEDNRAKESSSLLQSPRVKAMPNELYTTDGNHDTVTIEVSLSNKEHKFCGLDVSHVPYLLFASDFIICNGAGMTLNFFSLFFFTEYGLTPIQVQWLFVGEPLCVAMASFFSQWVSRYCGRMPVIVLTRVLGTTCLLLMSMVKSLHLQCVLFLLRTSMMRCTEPLRRSLLMDCVPKNQRARWNSLEGLTMFSYAGSAVIGGFLVEAHGYRYCFFITAMVYFVGVLMEIILIPVTRYAVETTSTLDAEIFDTQRSISTSSLLI